MNAVIALCNFCEVHGPSAVFCTQTLRDTKIEHLHLYQQSISNKICSACTSLGQTTGLYSKHNKSGSSFLSTQNAILPEVAALVAAASVRSLSCEIDCNKEGGFVFFGDSRGHALSHTFHVSDLQARGFYQLFSIIILMKDKYFLLNTKPFLSKHLRKVSTEIQALAQKVKEYEETRGWSTRQSRLSGSQVILQSARSLVNLTGEDTIFHILHSHFAWLLLAGSRFLTEHFTFGNLPWLPPQSTGRPPQQFVTYNITTLPMIQKYEDSLDDPEQEELFSLRHIKQVLPEEFTAVCYCALTGVKIIVHGSPEHTFHFMLSLTKLLPEQMHHLIRIDAQHQHSISAEYKIISVSNKITIPAASSSVFRIDFVDDSGQASVKWSGEFPDKLPQLLTKFIKAVDEPHFTDIVINKQTKVLIEEWKNKVICLNRAKSSNSISKLKEVLGIQSEDEQLINYWGTYLQ